MSDSVNFKYTMTEEDVVSVSSAQFTIIRGKWRHLWIAPVILLGMIYVFMGNWSGFWQLAAIVAVLGLAKLLMTHLVKWTARKSPHIGVEYETTASPDGMTWNSPLASTQSRWTGYTSVRETAGYFLFYCGLAMCAAIPKRSFADPKDMDRFRDLIRAHVPNAKLLDRPEK